MASAAPTRFWITRITSTIRVVSPTLARTSSPGDTVVAGFAGRSLTRTCPPRHAAAASGRVFVSRTAHNHRSTRVDSMTFIMDCRHAWGTDHGHGRVRVSQTAQPAAGRGEGVALVWCEIPPSSRATR